MDKIVSYIVCQLYLNDKDKTKKSFGKPVVHCQMRNLVLFFLFKNSILENDNQNVATRQAGVFESFGIRRYFFLWSSQG